MMALVVVLLEPTIIQWVDIHHRSHHEAEVFDLDQEWVPEDLLMATVDHQDPAIEVVHQALPKDGGVGHLMA
jgi:hypothetical protein